MNQEKTIKQLADELGVSKQAIRDKIAKLKLSDKLQINGNQFVISKSQENLIKSAFIENKLQSKNEKLLCDNSQTLQLLCSALQEQLSVLQKQLDVKDKQIEDLNLRLAEANNMVVNAQQLHCADKALELKEASDENEIISENKPKKHWWQKKRKL